MTPVPASGETPPQLRKAAASLRPEERSVTLLGPGVKQDYPAVRLRAFTGLSCSWFKVCRLQLYEDHGQN